MVWDNSFMYLKVGCFFLVLFMIQGFCVFSGDFMDVGYLMLYNFSWVLGSGLEFSFFIDKWGLIFSLTVSFISMNVLFFSNHYMKGELYNSRFIGLMVLFILSMNLLIFFPNIIFLMLGWDGLGLVSFLLVIHYQTPGSLAAGYITVLSNRIGDVLILLSIPLFLSCGGFLSSLELSEMGGFSVMMMLAGMTKSAQIPFSSWLPAAMAAPTPISALVHSSTLVTAGVYLIFRFYPMISLGVWFKPVLLVCSSMTMLMAGLNAFVETDMKKVVALSTLSQLGVMMFSLSVGLPELAFFHLVSHATFKALLFIGVGKLISQYSHNQDFRLIGSAGGWNLSLGLSNLSLIGFPFLASYYSKDLIIESSMGGLMSFIMVFVLMISTGMTLGYSYRMMKYLYSGSSWGTPMKKEGSGGWSLDFSILLMCVYVVFSGGFVNWVLLFPYPHPIMGGGEKMFLMVLFSAMVGVLFTVDKYFLDMVKSSGFKFIYSMWYLSFTNSQFMMMVSGQSGKLVYEKFDMGWNEIFVGKSGVESVYKGFSGKMINYYILSSIGVLVSVGLIVSVI